MKITAKELRKQINAYNRALLFHRKKAKQIRLEAGKNIYQFAEGKLKLESREICDLMNAYIITFGLVDDCTVTKDARRAFSELNDFAPVHVKFNRKGKGNLSSRWLIFKSSVARKIALATKRYDVVKYHAEGVQENDTASSSTENKTSPKQTWDFNEDYVSRRDIRRTQRRRFWQAVRSQGGAGHARKAVITVLGTAILTVGGIFGIKYSKAVNGNNKTSDKTEVKTAQPPSLDYKDTVQFTGLGLNTASDSNRITYKPQMDFAKIYQNKQEYQQKQNAVKIATAETTKSAVTQPQKNTQSKKIVADTINHSERTSEQQAWKNYYDNSIALHLGEAGRDSLYAQVEKALQNGNFKPVANEDYVSRFAMVATIYKLVRPNSKENKLIQKALTEQLSGEQQTELRKIIDNAGRKGQHIKGTGTHSNYDNSSQEVRKAHRDVIQKLKDCGRLYR